MNFFDISAATMVLVLVVGQLLTGALVFAYTSQHERSKALNTLLLSKVLQPLAWILTGIRAYVPGLLIIVASNILLMAGSAVELIAFMMLLNGYTAKSRNTYLTMLVSFIVLFCGVTLLGASISIRIFLVSVALATLIAYPIYRIVSEKHASHLQKMVAASFGAAVLMQLFRAVAAVATDLDMTITSSSLVNNWLFMLLYLQMLIGSLGFILLDKEKIDAELIRMASIDGLTSSLNRQTFEMRAAEMIAMFTRRHEPVACILLDIDDFKHVNDTHGHSMGDTVLRSIAGTIKGQLRTYDLFGRYGGEEFAVLLPGTNDQQAMDIAERLRAAVEALKFDDHPGLSCTISVGVSSIIPDRETTTEVFYRLSDKALYHAKDLGKNRVQAASTADDAQMLTQIG
ncbi:MAG: GGDEF domain-containing protein [Christensenellales bacterium]